MLPYASDVPIFPSTTKLSGFAFRLTFMLKLVSDLTLCCLSSLFFFWADVCAAYVPVTTPAGDSTGGASGGLRHDAALLQRAAAGARGAAEMGPARLPRPR